MSGFIFFLFFIFFLLPMIKKAFGSGKTPKSSKSYAQAKREIEARVAQARQNAQNQQNNPWEQKNKHGHSGKRQRTHADLHQRDSDNDVFPDEHLQRVKMRDKRDQAKRMRMEKNIHRTDNKAIRRMDNKGVDGWGARGDGIGGGGAIVFLALGALAVYFVISKYFPDMLG